MKKITKIISALLMLTVLAVALAACSGGGSGIAGKTFKFDKIMVNGEDQTEMMSAIVGDWSISFKEGGKCSMSVSGSGFIAALGGEDVSDSADCTYEQNGDAVVLKNDDGETMEFKLSGSKLSLKTEESGQTVEIVFAAK